MTQRERVYRAFHVTNPYEKVDKIIADIMSCLFSHDIDHLVPSIRVEKRSHNNPKKKGGFYLFIEERSGCDFSTDLGALKHLLVDLKRYPELQEKMTWEQIKHMVGPEEKSSEETKPLAYDVPPPPPIERSEEPPSRWGYENTDKYDTVLAFLSALGAGRWDQFQNVVAALWEKNPRPSVVIRRLKLLGHLERDGDRWAMAPPTLVATPTPSTYFLAGARDGELIRALDGRVDPQPNGSGPSRALVRADDVDGIIDRAKRERGVCLRVADALSYPHALPTIDEWSRSLNVVDRIYPAEYDQCKRLGRLSWFDCEFDSTKSGFYQLWRSDDSSRPAFEGYWDSEEREWRRADWYGMRFLARRAQGHPIVARFDSATKTLDVPEFMRWPEMFERALTLSGGWLPERIADGHWLRYCDVSPAIVEILRDKIGWTDADSPDGADDV